MRLINWRFLWKRRWYLLLYLALCMLIVTLFRTKKHEVLTTHSGLLKQRTNKNGFHFSSITVATRRLSTNADVISSHSPPVHVVNATHKARVDGPDQQSNSQIPLIFDHNSNPGSKRGFDARLDHNSHGKILRVRLHRQRSRAGGSRAGDVKNTRDSTRARSHKSCDTWCRRGENMSPPYNLTAVLLVRIYREDLAGLTTREMMQWLFYLRYAGVEHVYVYDAYQKKEESQRSVLQPLVQSGYVTYVDWSEYTPYSMVGTQLSAYNACLRNYGNSTSWHLSTDIDEYPFSLIDQEQNFLQRFLAEYSKSKPDVSQVLFQNFLFLGKPLPDLTNPILIDRFRRRTHTPANRLVKPVFKPVDVSAVGVHHNMLMRSHWSTESDERRMRLNHYWGARLQDWGEDTPKVLGMTEPDFSIKPIVEEIKQCSECLGEDLLYVRRWN